MQKAYLLENQLLVNSKNNGGQNPIEAAKLNCKIYYGPYVSNFEETYNTFQMLKIAKK